MTLSGHYWTLRRFFAGFVEPGMPAAALPWRHEATDALGTPLLLSGAHLPAESDELLVVLHGLGGSIRSRYMPRVAHLASRRRLSVLLLNARGAGEDDQGIAHAGLTLDLQQCLSAPSLARFSHVYLLGYSMGGHVALRYASENPDPRLRAVVAVCSPLQLEASMRAFDRPRFSVYRQYVLRALMAGYERWSKHGGAPVAIEQLRGIRSIREWDERVVVPTFGFESVWAYYASQSASRTLARLQVPGLYLGARHDPMVPFESVRTALQGAPKQLEIHWAEIGGHLAFGRGFRLHDAGEPGLESQVLGWLCCHGHESRSLPESGPAG